MMRAFAGLVRSGLGAPRVAQDACIEAATQDDAALRR
jgi:hypothetical protein